MAKIYKTYFESITTLYDTFSKIGMINGVFLIKDACGISDDSDSDRIEMITLSDYSVIHIMDSEYFHIINRDAEISFDWTEIYFFEGQSLEKCKNIYSAPKKELIEKSDLSTYFKQKCDFWAASIDGNKLWLTSSSILAIQSIFLSSANKYEEQKDLRFFNLVCNDLLFST